MESPYSSVLIWYFYVHCNLALFGSEAQGSICEICPTNLASFLGFLGFFMDLLVQDSIWIYLFSLWPYGPIHSLWWWNLCSEGGHYTTLHCLSLGVFPVGSSNIAASATTSRELKTSFFFAPAFLLLSTMAFVVYLVPTLVSGLWIGSFWVLRFVSYGYILPFKLTPIQSLWAWDSRILILLLWMSPWFHWFGFTAPFWPEM